MSSQLKAGSGPVKTSRRTLLKRLGLGAAGLGALTMTTPNANAALPKSDVAILNFALNLEYLEAEYYSYATTGTGIQTKGVAVTGVGRAGTVTVKGSPQVPFVTTAIRQYANEIAADEIAHVKFLRRTLTAQGHRPVARPAIDLQESFSAAARAAGVIGEGESFDPFANEIAFLIGAFIFEDLGVTAYRGAAPLLVNKSILSNAAGILAVEAYHAATIRAKIFESGGAPVDIAQKVSDLRDSADGGGDRDQGVLLEGVANIVPTNPDGVAFSRSIRQVLDIAYLNPGATSGGFFPQGVNFSNR